MGGNELIPDDPFWETAIGAGCRNQAETLRAARIGRLQRDLYLHVRGATAAEIVYPVCMLLNCMCYHHLNEVKRTLLCIQESTHAPTKGRTS